MTIKEAAIISAFTGFLIGKIGPMHKYIEKVAGHPVVTHQLMATVDKHREVIKADFVSIEITE